MFIASIYVPMLSLVLICLDFIICHVSFLASAGFIIWHSENTSISVFHLIAGASIFGALMIIAIFSMGLYQRRYLASPLLVRHAMIAGVLAFPFVGIMLHLIRDDAEMLPLLVIAMMLAMPSMVAVRRVLGAAQFSEPPGGRWISAPAQADCSLHERLQRNPHDRSWVEMRYRFVDPDTARDWNIAARSAVVSIAARVFDIALATTGLLVLSPLLIIVALLIRFEDGGPIFYMQRRVGLNGRIFNIIKFRSMRVDAETAGTPVWASRHDPRVTSIGAFLRAYRLDELPQLVNILLGHLAIVGPRPERPEIVAELARRIPNYELRHLVKPGLTGWAQISYPYGASVLDAWMKTGFDFFYLKHRTVWLDLAIMMQTIRIVLFAEGAR